MMRYLHCVVLMTFAVAAPGCSQQSANPPSTRAIAGPALADHYEDATAAYNRGDYATAVRLLLPLASGGNRTAQYNLGLMYDLGQGVPQNDAEAMRWYLKAAEQGEGSAQTNLGFMYANGKGVPQDYAEAVKWYRKAANQGEPGGQLNLGLMYAEGEGVPQDYAEAHKWLTLAASRFPASEADNRDAAIKNRDSVAAKMTPQQVSQAQKLASEWKPTK
jgi:TPR repeat protein